MVDETSPPRKPKRDWDAYGVVIASLLAGTGQLGDLTIDEDEPIGDCPIADGDKFTE